MSNKLEKGAKAIGSGLLIIVAVILCAVSGLAVLWAGWGGIVSVISGILSIFG